MELLIFVLVGFALIFLYFLPFIIAVNRKSSNRIAIFLLNFFLGWTIGGWIVLLFWSSINPTEYPTLTDMYCGRIGRV